jgi:hypothetical protein
VNGSIVRVQMKGETTRVSVRQDGQMPAPVVLRVEFAEDGPDLLPMDNAQLQDDGSAIVSWPVDVWFSGQRIFHAQLSFGSRKIVKITLDPFGRFPDNNTRDNDWEPED